MAEAILNFKGRPNFTFFILDRRISLFLCLPFKAPVMSSLGQSGRSRIYNCTCLMLGLLDECWQSFPVPHIHDTHNAKRGAERPWSCYDRIYYVL
jgi:hypothetical protein